MGGFDEQLSSVEDHDLWMRVAVRGVRVACVRERLAYFTLGPGDRISFNASARLRSMELFVAKWRQTIVRTHGKGAYLWFKNDYRWKVSFPILMHLAKHGRVGSAVAVYARCLVFNPLSYGRLLGLLFKVLRRWRRFAGE
jgi:hypothetical protein